MLHDTRVRFLLVGGLNTGLDIGAYTLLRYFGWPAILANLCSTSLGLASSFLLNRHFTFRTAGSKGQLPVFLAVTLAGLWVLQPLILYATARLFAGWLTGTVLTLATKLCATTATIVWNYLWYSRRVFRP